MGIFKDLFSKSKSSNTTLTKMQMMSGYTSTFTTWGDDPYDADTVRAVVDVIARNTAKLKPKHIRRINGSIITTDSQIEKMLQIRPNRNMNAYDFYYKMVTTLLIDNNVYAYPVWEGATLKEIWMLNPTLVEFMEDNTGNIYVRFTFSYGSTYTFPYSEVIHLRRHFYKNDILAEGNSPINSTLDAIHTTNEGLAEAVKSSATLKGIIKYQGVLREEDIKANRDRFVNEYMSMNNNGGIAAMDSKAEYIELKNTPVTADAEQMKELRENVYRYYGVSEAILKSDFTESQANAFYSNIIEPIAIQLSLEFTNKLFTEREIGHGNEIIFSAKRLTFANNDTKVAMARELVPMGILSINEMREIMELEPIETDRRLMSLNYVDFDKANSYQLGGDVDEERTKNDGSDSITE